MRPKWIAVFNEHGGYDCMSSSWDIQDTEGNHIATLDLADNPTAERDAKLIVEAVNGPLRQA